MTTIVIGGGIAGLHAAYRILNSDTTITIKLLEASKRLGGRVHTVKHDGFHMDAGAGRFAGPEQHPCLWALIRDLGLEKEVIELPKSGEAYVKDGTEVDGAHMERIHEALRKAAATEAPPSTMSFEMWARSILPSGYNDLMYASGYQSPFDRLSAAEAMTPDKSFLYSTWTYYVFRGGMSTLTKALERFLRKSGRCEICLGAGVTNIERSKGQRFQVKMKNTSITGNAVVLCLTRDALLEVAIPLLSEVQGLHEAVKATRVSPLDRIYARFPLEHSGEPWFSYTKTTSDGAVRQFIPIDRKNGIAMACYTEGIYAEQWGDVKSQAELQELLMKGLKRVFPKKHIPDPLWMKRYHWAVGAHFDAIGGCAVSTALKRGIAKNEIIGWRLMGEAVSRHHKGWIEGALSSYY